MHRRHQVSDRLLQLASLQAHVVTRNQAVGHGMSRHSISRLVESGSWRRLARGLFLTVPLEPSWDSLAWGGVLLGGQSARLGPESSGYLHQLLRQAPNPLDVLVPHQRRIEVPGSWHFIRERAGVRPARSVKDPPRLTIESTVLDLTDVRDAGEVVELVTTAVQRRLTTVKRLRQGLDARARHRHRALLHDLLADVGAGSRIADRAAVFTRCRASARLAQGQSTTVEVRSPLHERCRLHGVRIDRRARRPRRS
jgi:predicted transcriptional regulator of viral defense system